jgi:pyruvate/2-oxoglutarate/acetoin dehydrogenase E1 component
MKFKDSIKQSMEMLAKDEKTIFIGYNVKYGNKGGGAFTNILDSQLLETPPAENLMVGLGTGLSLKGFKPIVYFERFDFILNGLDAIVNHLMKFDKLSKEQYKPKVIFRIVVGRKQTPFFSGLTHTQDFTDSMRLLLNFPVIAPKTTQDLSKSYEDAFCSDKSCMIIEKADLYEIDC